MFSLAIVFVVFVDQGYLATVELQMESFRTLNPMTISEDDCCDHRGGGDCDFVFYVHNCSRSDGINYECTERIKRFYGPSDTNTFRFKDGVPSTAFLIDRFPRELVVNITVFDEDEGWSRDDFVGNYIVKFEPAIISNQRGLPPLQNHVVTIPDHSQLTVKYRAYCNDEDCRRGAGSTGFNQDQQPVTRVSRSTVFSPDDPTLDSGGTVFTNHIQSLHGDDNLYDKNWFSIVWVVGYPRLPNLSHLSPKSRGYSAGVNKVHEPGPPGRRFNSFIAGSVPIEIANSIIDHPYGQKFRFPQPDRSFNSLDHSFHREKTPFVRALSAGGEFASKLIRATRLVRSDEDVHMQQAIRILPPKDPTVLMDKITVRGNSDREATILVAKQI